MSDMKFISGELPDGRMFAQWWTTAKLGNLTRDECVAEVWERGGRFGVTVLPEAPGDALDSVREALVWLEQGRLPAATHTVSWKFGKPTFTAVAA